jgi:hypothetical protein
LIAKLGNSFDAASISIWRGSCGAVRNPMPHRQSQDLLP